MSSTQSDAVPSSSWKVAKGGGTAGVALFVAAFGRAAPAPVAVLASMPAPALSPAAAVANAGQGARACCDE
eukprot:CAMPEP_0172907580 /NCGR_PEP_ID=MMETSP1075-20121228/179130_1 /TAXON_ID=2916 /ORGANISM="Ceratium fusus, Strain PA161109" /LENGTH=70 /DNA_ID=CAMNT_0013765217 /DNA_START=21 /DNA_END=233 /DNA_ORIENTATION=-